MCSDTERSTCTQTPMISGTRGFFVPIAACWGLGRLDNGCRENLWIYKNTRHVWVDESTASPQRYEDTIFLQPKPHCTFTLALGLVPSKLSIYLEGARYTFYSEVRVMEVYEPLIYEPTHTHTHTHLHTYACVHTHISKFNINPKSHS